MSHLFTPLNEQGEARRLKPARTSPFLLSVLSVLSLPPVRRSFHGIHIIAGVALECQNFSFGKHVAGIHFLLQIADACKCVVGCIVFVSYEPAATGDGLTERGIGTVLHIPSVVCIQSLETPKFVAANDG